MSQKKYRFNSINVAGVFRVLGWLMVIEGAFMCLPLVTCLIYGESDWLAFAIAAGGTALLGTVMTRLLKAPTSKGMGKREGFLLTALVWVVFSIFGMIPFMICSTPVPLDDAFFEAMSGFTTTGASVLGYIDSMSHGIQIWRALTQWIGGMGIIIFTLAVIPMLNSSGGMQMFNAEVTGITHDKIRPRISQTAKTLWGIYIALTLLLIFFLWLGPMGIFDSVCHAFGAISTGGFSTDPDGIYAWHSVYVKVVLTIFMFLGGVNFSLMFRVIRGDFRALRKNDVFRTYVGIILVTLVIFIIDIVARGCYTNWESVSVDPLFQIVSTITSTGYTPTNFESWGPLVLSITFFLMLCGACAGSTTGGAKIDRMLFLFKNSRNEIYRCVYPNSIQSVKVNGKVVSPDLVNKVIAFLCIYMLLIGAGGLVLTALGMPVIDSFFSSFSCLGNTGLGAGITGFGSNYEIVPCAGKWVLSFLMLVGRLEIFTVLIILTRPFWRK